MEKERGTESSAGTTASRRRQVKLFAATEKEGTVTLEEGQLVSEARRGCADSFSELVSRHSPGLLEFLRHRTATVEDAEDLVQETFVRAYLKLEQFSGQWRFSTWLYTIGRRLAINYYRKRRFGRLPEDFASPYAAPEDILVRREASVNLWSIARSLPANQYEAVWLKYSEAMSVRQIAHVMKKSEVYVKVLLYRGRVKIGRQLKLLEKERSRRRVEGSGSNYRIHESAGV